MKLEKPHNLCDFVTEDDSTHEVPEASRGPSSSNNIISFRENGCQSVFSRYVPPASSVLLQPTADKMTDVPVPQWSSQTIAPLNMYMQILAFKNKSLLYIHILTFLFLVQTFEIHHRNSLGQCFENDLIDIFLTASLLMRSYKLL